MKRIFLAVLLTSCGVGKTRTDLPVPTPEPPSDCADDAREEDDSLVAVGGTEKSITGQRFVKVDGVSCPGDDDWIHGHRSCCGPAGVEVTWNAAEGDLRVDLLGSDGRPIMPEENDVKPGKIRVMRTSHGQDFYIRIRNRAGTRVSYSAAVRFTE